MSGVDVLLISVRTDETRFINRAFMLASSRWPPKPGSADAVQPTESVVSPMFCHMDRDARYAVEIDAVVYSGWAGRTYFARGNDLPRGLLWRL